MPIYEYTCRKCKAHVEILQKMTDKPLAKCKKCGGRLEKEWSRSGVQFKGTGWYVTDYARKGSVAEKVEKELSSDTSSEKPKGGDKEKPKPASKKSDKA